MDKQPIIKIPERKKIGLLSCIVVVIGACIGAGIFFKNGSILANTQHSLILAILCWVISGLGVLCMGLALTEIVSGCKKQSNLGIAYWIKTFNNRFLYKACRNFLVFIYTPIILIALSYYFIQALFSAINPLINWYPKWWQCMLGALFILCWFFFTSGISVRFFNVQSWIIMCFKFIPLIFAIVIGYVVLGHTHQLPSNTDVGPKNTHHYAPLLTNYSPVLGIIASMPAIFFAFNGFQYPASITSDMKNPKQLPLSMLLGIIIVIVVYVLISLSLIIGSSDGGITGLKTWLDSKHVGWIYPIIYILIGIGVLSVINGTVTTGVNYCEEFLNNNELPLSNCFNSLSRKAKDKPIGGVIFCFVMTMGFFALCTVIGCFYLPIDQPQGASFDKASLGIFSFADVMSNWDALFIYMFIGMSFVGGLINRKTFKVDVVRSKMFVPTAIISVSLISLSILYLIVQIFTDLGLVVHYYNINKPFEELTSISKIKKHWENQIISKVMAIGMFIVYMTVMFVPAWISERKLKLKLNITNTDIKNTI